MGGPTGQTRAVPGGPPSLRLPSSVEHPWRPLPPRIGDFGSRTETETQTEATCDGALGRDPAPPFAAAAAMEEDRPRVADYFVIAGLPEAKAEQKLLDEYSLEVNLKTGAYQDPITDITVGKKRRHIIPIFALLEKQNNQPDILSPYLSLIEGNLSCVRQKAQNHEVNLFKTEIVPSHSLRSSSQVWVRTFRTTTSSSTPRLPGCLPTSTMGHFGKARPV